VTVTIPQRRPQHADIVELLQSDDLLALGTAADAVRQRLHPENIVTYIIDRNINYTNVCVSRCSFCAFSRDEGAADAYVLTHEELGAKIEEALALGATQVLLQGGMHPSLPLGFYLDMLRFIKQYPIHVHGFSPPEIVHIARIAHLPLPECLERLRDAGLDTIPGGGAEILSDRVRREISPRKCSKAEWLEVMRTAHAMGMRTTATMMFGHVETPEDIAEHLIAVRELQDETGGFTAFIPWTFQPENTELGRVVAGSAGILACKPGSAGFQPADAGGFSYLRVLAVSRIALDNIANIQASWVTQGGKLAQVALRFGANDMGSTMIEENVVAAAGVTYRLPKEEIVRLIETAGFEPRQRDTYYTVIARS
jgi:cyclic dehypoxanthinyl futalosine synthase